jgi:hypothetical protein
MAEEKGVKEILELLKGLEVGGPLALKIIGGLKDGLGADDVANLLALASNASIFLAAVEGLAEVPAEAKNLSEDEVIQVVAAAYAVARAFKAARAA